MVQRTYNNFTPWVQQDDFFTNWPNFIEHKNIDGLRDGYWVTLWPKINKQLTTGTNAIYSMDGVFSWNWDTDRVYLWGENGVIYTLDSTDNTPEHTLSGTKHIVKVLRDNNDLYFFYKDSKSSSNVKVAYITEANANSGTWGSMNESFIISGITTLWTIPTLRLWGFVYVWQLRGVVKMDNTGILDTFSFVDDYVVSITLQGSTVVLYSRSGNVYFWDAVATTYSSIATLWSRIAKAESKAGVDYITTEDGQLYIGSWTQFQRITRPKMSNRMNNNSSYDTRLDFSINQPDGISDTTTISALADMYINASDTIPWIYKYGRLIPWMQDWLHKITTQNNAGTQIDYVYTMLFYERTLRRLYFSYKASSTYWVDYIDMKSLETCSDGYMITEVFSGWTSLKKSLGRMRRATSNTAWDNFIKLYYRVNNWSWVLIRNINDATNEIERENMKGESDTSPFQDFVDVQLKIELHNETRSEDAPTLHEIMQEYEAIET